jgi:hypothetical protein
MQMRGYLLLQSEAQQQGPLGAVPTGSTTVQAGSAASIAGRATAAALISAARGGTVGDAFKAAVMAGGSDFLANSEIVKSTLDSLKGYFNSRQF